MKSSNQYIPFEIDNTQYIVPIEYVAYIVTSSDDFPSCILPKSPAFIKRVMSIQHRLIPVIEQNLLYAYSHETETDSTHQRPFILLLTLQDAMLGLLTDVIDSPLELSPSESYHGDSADSQILVHDFVRYVLFDVLRFYGDVTAGQSAG